jgi:hypothetical protein
MAGSVVDVWMVALQVAAFSVAAVVLLLAHARDARTGNLGMSLLLIASAFATSHFADLVTRWPRMQLATTWYPDAFLAVFIGRFIREFPRRRTGLWDRVLRRMIVAATVAGGALFVANVLRGVVDVPFDGVMALLQRRSEGGNVYWTVIFGFVAAMLPMALAGASEWRPDERRRVKWFWGAFVLGIGPIVLVVVLGSLPVIGPPLTAWATSRSIMVLFELLLATVPLTVAYAVIVEHLLPLRVVIHHALQYVFARWTVTAAAIVPIVVLAAQAYSHRHETIADAMSGRTVWLVAAIAVSSLAVIFRPTILLLIDRWFFREAYDAREVLMELGERARRAHGIDELVALITAGIDRALRPHATVVMVRDEKGTHFVSLFGTAEPLPASYLLVDVVRALDGAALDVQLEHPSSPLKWLPLAERQWLVDSQASLLLPLATSDGSLAGIISLGPRKSELPYSENDRRLLTAIADAGALAIETHAFRMGAPSSEDTQVSPWWHVSQPPRSQQQAMECADCGSVQSPDDSLCARCLAPLQTAGVPMVLFGKFRFEQRVGRGGMGVVYRARDLLLERTVAIKTLPGTSPEAAQRLRYEARAMAAVTHKHLATIHGAESWRGRPMLVCEFMEHGTLATRLESHPLSLPEMIELGLALADALQVIHGAGLLHRDIKPSNIGFASGGVPKLLDFGLAHMLSHAQTPAQGHAVIGTPAYLAPEAYSGHSPTPMFDLWSLNVLLLEAISGTHPFRGRTAEETMSLIREARRPRVLDVVTERFSKVAEYFEGALSRNPGHRPRNATELSNRLRQLAP